MGLYTLGATRIGQLQQWMPEALQYYKGPGRLALTPPLLQKERQ